MPHKLSIMNALKDTGCGCSLVRTALWMKFPGNAGRGAAIGAGVGTVRGGRKQRQANEAAQEQGAQAAVSQQQQAYSQSKAAYNKQIDTFKRGFSACMDARGYSVK